MADVVKALNTFNGTLNAINGILAPTGPLNLAIAGIRAIIERRRAAGEDVKDLEVELDRLEAALTAADESIRQYWLIPVKSPVTSDPDQ